MSKFGHKTGQIGPKWDKMYWNLIWKSPGFVPFGANLTHFVPKSYYSDFHVLLFSYFCIYLIVNSLAPMNRIEYRMTFTYMYTKTNIPDLLADILWERKICSFLNIVLLNVKTSVLYYFLTTRYIIYPFANGLKKHLIYIEVGYFGEFLNFNEKTMATQIISFYMYYYKSITIWK